MRALAIQGLVQNGDVEPSLLDDCDLAEITSPELYPGQRLVVCRNPLFAAQRANMRQGLLAATEVALDPVVAATTRRHQPLRGRHNMSVRVDRALRKDKVGKHFDLQSTDDSCSWERSARDVVLDGIYIVRTNLPKDRLSSQEALRSFKSLSQVERAFRTYKTVDLKVRPVHHRLERQVRVHVFLCMLAYYVGWHMRRSLAPCPSMMRSRVSTRTLPLRGRPDARRRRGPRPRASARGRIGQCTVSARSSLIWLT